MRKLSLLLFLLFIIAQATYAQSAKSKTFSGNPILPGWYADPEAVIMDGKYWIYPTYSAPFDEQVFMDAFSSNDLISWKKHKSIIDTTRIKWAKRAMWAPSIVKKDGKYFLFFGANDVHEGETGGIGVGVSDKPEGPFRDHIGKPLIGGIRNGAQPIDQFVFQDKDGQYYMFYGGWRHCNVVKLSPDFKSIVPFPDDAIYKEITPKDYVEGPFMFIRNGKYYFMWSEGDWTGPDYQVSYAIADSPFGPFNKIGTILKQDPAVATGAGHHSVIKHPAKDQWYIVYHRRPLTESDGNHRATCIDEMKFDKDGKIVPVVITNKGVGRSLLK